MRNTSKERSAGTAKCPVRGTRDPAKCAVRGSQDPAKCAVPGTRDPAKCAVRGSRDPVLNLGNLDNSQRSHWPKVELDKKNNSDNSIRGNCGLYWPTKENEQKNTNGLFAPWTNIS